MAERKTIDCGSMPNDIGCTLVISGREDEVLVAAAEHAVSAHGHPKSPELTEAIRGMLRDEASIKT